jgi:hypothetical protein
MVALFDDSATVYYVDYVCFLDGGQPMGYGNGGATLCGCV